MPIDPYKRYQNSLTIEEMYPNTVPGYCACGCGKALIGRRTRWATNKCLTPEMLQRYWILKGDQKTIRKAVAKRDDAYCRDCGVQSWEDWEADHIIPVHKGGGGCGLENFQTLCKEHHLVKTIRERTKTL
jgi:5-methylcytosine-specific restriction endonuclease McrA